MNGKIILESLLKYLKTNKNALARELGTSASTFRNIETGRNAISSRVAKSIVERYSEVSYDWLMGEDCPMLIEPKETLVDEAILKQMKLLERLSEGQDAQIQLLKDRVKLLEQRFEPEKNLITT